MKFRELAKKTHPDKTKEDSEEEMVELNKAYEVLSDKESREKYDKYLKVD
jgi:curved DNA-binding protein CbpA